MTVSPSNQTEFQGKKNLTWEIWSGNLLGKLWYRIPNKKDTGQQYETKEYCKDCKYALIGLVLVPVWYLIETSDHRLRLLHHSPLHSPLGHALNVLLLVLLRHLEVWAARFQLPLCHLWRTNTWCHFALTYWLRASNRGPLGTFFVFCYVLCTSS